MFINKKFSISALLGLTCLLSLVAACSSSSNSEDLEAVEALSQQVEELQQQLELAAESPSEPTISTTTVPAATTTAAPAATTTAVPAPTTTVAPAPTTTVAAVQNVPDCEVNLTPGTVPSLCGFHVGDDYEEVFVGLLEIFGPPTSIGWWAPTCRGGYWSDTLEGSVWWGNLRVSFIQETDPDYDFTVYEFPYLTDWTIRFLNEEEIVITPEMLSLPGDADIEGSIEAIAEAFSIDLEDAEVAPYQTGELDSGEYWIDMMEYLEEEDYPEGFDGPEFGMNTGFVLHQHSHFGYVNRSIGVPSVPYCH